MPLWLNFLAQSSGAIRRGNFIRLRSRRWACRWIGCFYFDRKRFADENWAIAECLRCRGVSATIASPRRLSRIEARRFQLAAERGKGIGILLRPYDRTANVYSATTRWLVSPQRGLRTVQRWRIELIHGHGGQVGAAVILEHHRETNSIEIHPVRASEQLADRPIPQHSRDSVEKIADCGLRIADWKRSHAQAHPSFSYNKQIVPARVRRWSHQVWIERPRKNLTKCSESLALRNISAAAPSIRNPQSAIRISLVLVHKIAQRELIVAVNDAARSKSIRPGMTLSEARALDATVKHAPHEPHRDAVALEALARWMMRFSPIVATALPRRRVDKRFDFERFCIYALPAAIQDHGLFLDLTGCDAYSMASKISSRSCVMLSIDSASPRISLSRRIPLRRGR